MKLNIRIGINDGSPSRFSKPRLRGETLMAGVSKVTNGNNIAVTLLAADGDTVQINPGTTKVDNKFLVNLPPRVSVEGTKVVAPTPVAVAPTPTPVAVAPTPAPTLVEPEEVEPEEEIIGEAVPETEAVEEEIAPTKNQNKPYNQNYNPNKKHR